MCNLVYTVSIATELLKCLVFRVFSFHFCLRKGLFIERQAIVHLGEENVNCRKIEFRVENRNVYELAYLCFCGCC